MSAQTEKIGPINHRMSIRRLVPFEAIDKEHVWISPRKISNNRFATFLTDPFFYIRNACFAVGEYLSHEQILFSPHFGDEMARRRAILRPATVDMNRAHLTLHLNSPVIVGEASEARAYTIVSTKGSGETREDVYVRANRLSEGKVSERDNNTNAMQTYRDYLITSSPDPEGFFGRESREQEMFVQEVLRLVGVRVSHVQSVVPFRKAEFADWLEETMRTLPDSPYPAVEMLARVRQDGRFGPEQITRLGTMRYEAMIDAADRGNRYAKVETLQMNARAFLAEIEAKGEKAFRIEYDFAEPNLVSSLEAIAAGSATMDNYMVYLGLEIQLAAFNFGRSLWASGNLLGSRLLVDDPSIIQNYGLVATMHDFEEKLRDKPEVIVRREDADSYLRHFRRCFMDGPAIQILRNMVGAALPGEYMETQPLHRLIDRGFHHGFYPKLSERVIGAMQFDVQRLYQQYIAT